MARGMVKRGELVKVFILGMQREQYRNPVVAVENPAACCLGSFEVLPSDQVRQTSPCW